MELLEAEFFQDGTKVDDVLCSFDCRVRFCFGRAEGDDCLLLLLELNVPVLSPREKQTPVWDLESLWVR